MACVIVPAIEAIAVSMILKRMKKSGAATGSDGSPSWIRKLEWLNKALWGGTFLLVIEHIWHGEITFMPPFLTAMQSPAETEVMLREMATVGVSMAAFITVVWFIVTAVLDRFQEDESAETISTQ
ncbi:hypothetical protein FACS1894158_01130 [Betaproteobacteria bacterium]|nr:hypothetical protein FACS1894158_01130 [Betaproteobacteria bacterium]